jgi:hypothetical protein
MAHLIVPLVVPLRKTPPLQPGSVLAAGLAFPWHSKDPLDTYTLKRPRINPLLGDQLA